MKAGLFVLAAFLMVQPVFAQDPQPVADDKLTITGETFEKQKAAERSAAEARRLFAELREGSGDRAHACRAAAQAERDYKDAIQEVRQLADAAQPKAKERLEAWAKNMKERADGLDDLQDRACKAGGMEQRQGQGGQHGPRGGGGGRFP